MTQEKDREAFEHWRDVEGAEDICKFIDCTDNWLYGKIIDMCEEAWLNGASVATERYKDETKKNWEKVFKAIT